MTKRLLLALTICVAIAIGARFDSFIEKPVTALAQTNTFCAANLACTVTAAWTYSGGLTSTNTNNIIHVAGSTGQTIAAGLALCPAGTVGCHIVIDGNATVTTTLSYSTAGSPLEIECANPSVVNGNSGGTLITFTPAAASNFFTFSTQTRAIIKGCNFTQSNALLPATSGITNITWSGGIATANCSGTGANCANISVGQIVNIIGNAQLNAGSVTNYPVTVTATGAGTFSFQYPNSSTAAGGTVQPLTDAFQMNGVQGLRLVDSQIYNFPGVGMHLINVSGVSSAEYGEIENSHISFNGVNLAYTVIPPAGAQSANAHTLVDSVVGGASILNIMTTGGASEIIYVGGENSDGGKNLGVLDRFGDGVSSCRGPYYVGVTMESNSGTYTELGIDNRCQGAFIVWEGGLGASSATLISDGTGPGGICHWAFRTGASASIGEPSTPFWESTCPGTKVDSSGDIALNGAAIIPGGGNISGVAALFTGGNNTWLFSSSLIASGAPITAVYPSSATTTLGRFGNPWSNAFVSAITPVNLLLSSTAPTIAAAGCGGAAAAITAPNGTGSFEVSVGTTPGSACTITMPTATTSWTCDANTVSATTTTNFVVKQTGALSTTQVVLTLFSDVAAATAFQGSDTLRVKCSAN